MKNLVLASILSLGLAACSTATTTFINNDFAAAQAELAAAQKAGIIAPTDPLGPCLAAVVQGQQGLTGAVQQPSGIVSAGVELYILTQAIQQQGGSGSGLTVACDPVLGAIVRMGARRGLQIGAGAFIPGIPIPGLP